MMRCTFLPTLMMGVSVVCLPALANAQTLLFNNAPELDFGQTGDCVYNTTCGPQFTGDTFAVQRFTLSMQSTVTGLGFNAEVLGDTTGLSANYMLLTSSNANTPGSVIASGSSPLNAAIGPTGSYYQTTDYAFNVSPLTLKAGTYFFAFQNVTPSFDDYLSRGTSESGAFQSNDGGRTFSSTYQGFGSVAVSVYGDSAVSAVPEPSTWAMMLLGFGGLGFLAYRKTRNGDATAVMLAA